MPHLNNKQNKHTNPIINRQDYHLTQLCPSEEKQTNKQKKQKQHKYDPIQSLHKPLDQPYEGRNHKEERIQPSSRKELNFPWSLRNGHLKHNNFKKKKKKRQKNTAQMKEQTRNTEVQINEEEIGKLPEKE